MVGMEHDGQTPLVSAKGVKDDERPRKRVKGVEDDDQILPRKHVKSVKGDDDDDDEAVDLFVRLTLEGQWDGSILVLHGIEGKMDEKVIKSASLVILEQKYYELLDEDKFVDAFTLLKEGMFPLAKDNNLEKLNDMCCDLAFPPQNSLVRASSKKSKLQYRKKSLDELRKLLYPAMMISERRLLDAYHGVRDHTPSEMLQVLLEHKDKILSLQFSHSGKYLASSSGDCLVIVWEVMLDGHVSLKHRLAGHKKPVSFISWSPNDAGLVTCGVDEVVRQWDIASGQCLHIYEKSYSVGPISCAWSPDGKKIFSGVNDKSICMWDLEGKELECWKGKISDDLAGGGGIAVVSINDNEKEEILSVCKENMILLFGWETKSEKFIEEDQTITWFSLSDDGKLLLVCLSNGEVHLWNIHGFIRLLAKYVSHGVLRSCCTGGIGHMFIAGASDDSQVYIWHRASGELISNLVGHSGAINCVSWNPTNPHMLASGSDDHTICIWGSSLGKLKNCYC
ncbi:hypothetical protein OROHE_005420 [Orobanche hederae]